MTHGIIIQGTKRRTDYLYRVSLKCLVRNEKGEILVVKESGRGWWDLPGGGMDHGEDIRSAIAREMKEEVAMQGDFEYKILEVDEPRHLDMHNFWQLRLVFEVKPQTPAFSPGDDGDAVAFVSPGIFESSEHLSERFVFKYSKL